MRRLTPTHVTLAVMASGLTFAQDADPAGARRVAFDDGSSESLWKVNSPSGRSDWFNVDFDAALDQAVVVQIHCDSGETIGVAGRHASLGIYAEDAALPNTPDLSAAVVVRSPVVVRSADGVGSDSAYRVPKTVVPAGDHHVALHFAPGDSHTWCTTDANGTDFGRTYFTATNYRSGAVPLSRSNGMLAVGVLDDTAPGTLLVNGTTSARVEQDGGGLCLTFFGPAVDTASVLYLCVNGSPFVQLLPAAFTVTDGTFAGPCPMTWQICSVLDCNTPTGSGLEFCALYLDVTDLRPNGKPKFKLSSVPTLDVLSSSKCFTRGGAGDCFGVRDDCRLDSTIWMVQNPAGPSDWFSVNHGTTKGSTSPVSNLTGVSISSWDFCGFGPSWEEVGIYPPNTALDPTGCTPDLSRPLTSLGRGSARMPPGAGDWGCPLSFYDVPDVPADSTTEYHVGAQWPPNDSCIWLGSDTDGIDGPCGTPIPHNGCLSVFTTNGYSVPGVPFTSAMWMMQIDWN